MDSWFKNPHKGAVLRANRAPFHVFGAFQTADLMPTWCSHAIDFAIKADDTFVGTLAGSGGLRIAMLVNCAKIPGTVTQTANVAVGVRYGRGRRRRIVGWTSSGKISRFVS